MNIIEGPLVSIIIPIYNTEKYVRRAIESVLAQTYTNIEVVLVNDGSTDKSGAICDEYAQKDLRVIVIHQKNSGVSVARNRGIEMSKGKYIQFVDSDDEIYNSMTEALIGAMKEYNCDIVICGYSSIGRENRDVKAQTQLYECNKFLFSCYIDPKIISLVWSSCNMIFNASRLKENNLCFDPSFAMGEDGIFTLEYIKKCKNILVLDQLLYKRYLYDPVERISAISHFLLDEYELTYYYFERLFSALKFEINEKEKTMLFQKFYDKLIAGLVRLAAYSECFSDDYIKQRLSFIINSELVIQSGKVYKRTRKSDSILIPLFIKLRFYKFLYFALKRKGKQYIDKYGKRVLVRSIYNK